MTRPADPEQKRVCARAERDGPLGCNPRQIVELLTDDDARAIYRFLDEPTAVQEIAETLDLPLSTTYRKVEALSDAGLLTELKGQTGGDVPAHYVRALEHVSVTYDDPLRIECVENGTTLYCEPEQLNW
ncbi:helix-turn-helix domain-containing protein [Natronorubrum sp. JWXQ-INN-674]|uniref:Helix-turn-helix domain-containing protein n=1 Tax=Natronorubrum halalkaliphilum TaxID=2691917 RepID=A0A6B0VQB3_9EURY|nr:helix-turn-helix domain-containing protein [Natronorubrum halalkaliphilum]MXV63664.1 helix-turn-helix domain-containing protein [Natronorubrum halalkaliphilum]